MAGVVGEHQLVYGSDSPVVDPAELPSVIDEELVSETNPGRLLGLGVAL
jgi:predicted TIM-barrel fold metal-dependent hydrolase